MRKTLVLNIGLIAVLSAFLGSQARAQLDFAGFTYQGSLKDGANPANGNYEMVFEFFDAAVNGTPLGSISLSSVPVTNGVFSVTFTGTTGMFAPGANVWIQISVRPEGSGLPPTMLTPRQRITSTPFAISSLLSGDSQRLGGVDANQYVTTTSGAMSFIQNGTGQQTGGFNLSGTGTANILNAASQFQINSSRILSAAGADNIFAGFQAGQSNSTGSSNSFFGTLAGGGNTTGNFNSFFGRATGINNSGGNANSFFGSGAGGANSTGGNNSFFGVDAGSLNTSGTNNTIVGATANVASNGLTNASAFGYRATVASSNSLVLGSINGLNGATADTNVGIGTTIPTQKLHVVGNGVFSGSLGVGTTTPNYKFELIDSSNKGLRVQTDIAGGTVASFGGFGAFRIDAPGTFGGRFSILENGNVGIGTATPQYSLHVVGENIRVQGSTTSSFPRVSFDNTGGATDQKKWQIYASTDKLTFSSLNDAETSENPWFVATRNFGVGVSVAFQNAVVGINVLAGGGVTQLCLNNSLQISRCSSSLRYKTKIGSFSDGMTFVRQLRPISFDWKDGGIKDIGFGAEDIAEIDPRFVTYNDKGEVEGVKYDRLGVVFVNALKEQQQQIEAQQGRIEEQNKVISGQLERLERQESEIEELKQIVCANNRTARICAEKKP